MRWQTWIKPLARLWPFGRQEAHSPPALGRGPVDHVIILDGTMSSLNPGDESNAGLTYKLLCSHNSAALSLYYEAGVQWRDWRSTPDVLMGRGINRQIRRAYGYLASRYRAGDRIFLLGYSRGAYAVRSLAGMIDGVGLLKRAHATERNIIQAYRHYQCGQGRLAARDFARAYCHDSAPIEMVGVWDSVKALGLRLPLLWRVSEPAHAFHSHQLGPTIRHGFHALALDETRAAFEPVLWDCPPGHTGRVDQVWFRGTHGDIGGQLSGFHAARPLANIPLVWMLERAAECGLSLPEDWKAQFPTDPTAPSVSTWRYWGKLFLIRKARKPGQTRSERLHPTVQTGDLTLPMADPIA
ncbi:DUF2235 domain-containing protein [Roseovarius sp. 2305UL8-3]|uniref:DUF2235 domain-containing protein n=1 Tax=Roseovarius conchicola TaxID=3121636 RepID=UPI0035288020